MVDDGNQSIDAVFLQHYRICYMKSINVLAHCINERNVYHIPVAYPKRLVDVCERGDLDR